MTTATKLPFGQNSVDVYEWLHSLRNRRIPQVRSFVPQSPLARIMTVEADKVYKILYHGPDHEFGAAYMHVSYAGNPPVFHGRSPSGYGGWYAHLSFPSPCIVYTESWNTFARLIRQDVVYCATQEQLEHGTLVQVETFRQRLADHHEKHKDDGKKFAQEQIKTIMELGFTRQQAWNILNAASPSRCVHATYWAMDMAKLGLTRQQMKPVLDQLKTELPRVPYQERYSYIASKIPVGLKAPYQGESVFGAQKFFDGAMLALLFYEMNQRA